jgi:hypothetical protein
MPKMLRDVVASVRAIRCRYRYHYCHFRLTISVPHSFVVAIVAVVVVVAIGRMHRAHLTQQMIGSADAELLVSREAQTKASNGTQFV